jgi:hypothetical protein
MARPLRIKFPGAVYHVTSRGDRREPIFVDDADRLALLDVLGSGLDRFDACALAWCLMGNHYHFASGETGSGLAFCPNPSNLPQWPDHSALNSPARSIT